MTSERDKRLRETLWVAGVASGLGDMARAAAGDEAAIARLERSRKYAEVEATVLRELAEAGIVRGSLDDLDGRERVRAAPTLVRWLERPEGEPLRRILVGLLGVRGAAKVAWAPLLREYDHSTGSDAWLAGDSLANMVGDDRLDDVLPRVLDSHRGTDRQMIVAAMWKCKQRPEAAAALLRLLVDPTVNGQAVLALARSPHLCADHKEALELFDADERDWVRKAARRALKRLGA